MHTHKKKITHQNELRFLYIKKAFIHDILKLFFMIDGSIYTNINMS
jgi:hypothetical protein